MSEFIISGFADEIDASIDKQLEHLKTLNMKYFEVRGVDEKNISDLTFDEANELKEKMDKNGICASSIGSPIGKIFINEPFVPHLEKLRHTIEIAKILNTNYIRIFSFFIPNGENPDEFKDEVLKRMSAMVELAEKENVILLHENEKEIFGDTPERIITLFENIKSPSFKAVFDPANFIQCGVETKSAFKLLKSHIAYMHIKDAMPDGTVVPAGKGVGNVEYILSELYKSGYCGYTSLEPHLGTFAGLSALELDDKMLALEESGPNKFTIAYNALTNILKRVEK